MAVIIFESADSLLSHTCLQKTFYVCIIVVLSSCIWLTQIHFMQINVLNKLNMFDFSFKAPLPVEVDKFRTQKFNQTISDFKRISNSEETKLNPIQSTNAPSKIIKIYYNRKRSWWDPVDFRLCKTYKGCTLINDNRRTDECSALILEHTHLPRSLPHRVKDQMWTFVSHEPPSISSAVYRDPKWRYQFNWTMTFRMDSTFPFPWGYIVPSNHSTKANFEEIYSRKTKSIAWIVSNCRTQSRREDYVNILSKYIDVDKYGRCSKVSCQKSRGFSDPNDKCRGDISKQYKFYLSFENSLCKDYTTEKLYVFYKYRRHIIPVIRGSSEAKHILPPNTFINAADFANAHELGKYLKDLGNDKERYIAMLKAKDAVDAETQAYTFKKAMCSVCETLHQYPIPKSSQIDLKEWNDNAGCKKPDDLS